jgi:hypothetical protein
MLLPSLGLKNQHEASSKQGSPLLKLDDKHCPWRVSLISGLCPFFTGKPKRDENGHVIEDEFSQMPFIQQFFSRMWKEMDYYKRVCLATQSFGCFQGAVVSGGLY